MAMHTEGDGARAFGRGLLLALRAPVIIVVLYVALLGVTLPFAAWLGQHLATQLARTHPDAETPEGIDAEWWLDFRQQASGLAATFTPNVIGFAAPLENLSAVLEATPRPWMLLGPVLVFALISAWLWGGILARLQSGRAIGIRGFIARSHEAFPRVFGVNVAAIFAVAVAYVVVHPILFGPLLSGLALLTTADAGRVVLRVALYLVFGGLLVVISVLADYARIAVVLGDARHAGAGYRAALALLRTRWRAVAMVMLLMSMGFAALLIAYGVIDLQGGSRVGGWRAVGIAQAFIIGRVVLRVVNAAAQIVVASPAAT
jgi:hypothetical protein